MPSSIRKPLAYLTLRDLSEVPVWELCEFPVRFAAEVELEDTRLVDRGVIPAFLFVRYENGEFRLDAIR